MYYLTDTLPEDHRFRGLTAAPVTDTVPELWLLGSSDGSASVAANMGTAFTFAHFINGEGGVDVVDAYRSTFQPSVRYAQPETSVAIFVFCADTDEDANRMAASLDLSLVRLANGQRQLGTPTVEMALAYPYNKYELALVRENRKRMIIGSPASVKQQIEELAKTYGTDEVMIATNAADFNQRLHSYELVAEAFHLQGK